MATVQDVCAARIELPIQHSIDLLKLKFISFACCAHPTHHCFKKKIDTVLIAKFFMTNGF
jgi:hypothetical protein